MIQYLLETVAVPNWLLIITGFLAGFTIGHILRYTTSILGFWGNRDEQ